MVAVVHTPALTWHDVVAWESMAGCGEMEGSDAPPDDWEFGRGLDPDAAAFGGASAVIGAGAAAAPVDVVAVEDGPTVTELPETEIEGVPGVAAGPAEEGAPVPVDSLVEAAAGDVMAVTGTTINPATSTAKLTSMT